jgi:Kef-type K+ transport system membrane component KefB
MPPDRIPLLLADLALILLLARLLGAAARRVGQPAVVGEIVAGVVAGPTLGHGAVTSVFFPPDIRGLLGAVANLGLALFMFEVGTEFEPGLLKGAGRVAASVSMASMALPFGLGVVLALEVLPASPGPHHLESALFLGTAMSVTAFPVLARILADRGMLPSPLGSLALQCAAVADVIARSCSPRSSGW